MESMLNGVVNALGAAGVGVPSSGIAEFDMSFFFNRRDWTVVVDVSASQ